MGFSRNLAKSLAGMAKSHKISQDLAGMQEKGPLLVIFARAFLLGSYVLYAYYT